MGTRAAKLRRLETRVRANSSEDRGTRFTQNSDRIYKIRRTAAWIAGETKGCPRDALSRRALVRCGSQRRRCHRGNRTEGVRLPCPKLIVPPLRPKVARSRGQGG